MKKYDWDKLFTLCEEKAEKFKWVAEPIVEATVVSDDDNKKVISHLSAIDMAIGEEVTKNKHILTGVIIGTVGTGLTVVLVNKIKNKKEKVELFNEEDEWKIRIKPRVMKKLEKYRKNK